MMIKINIIKKTFVDTLKDETFCRHIGYYYCQSSNLYFIYTK